MNLAACSQNAFQESLLKRRAADSRIPAQRDHAPSGKRSEGNTHTPGQLLCEIGAVDTSNIISSKDGHETPVDLSV
jgi:hypothetical protein